MSFLKYYFNENYPGFSKALFPPGAQKIKKQDVDFDIKDACLLIKFKIADEIEQDTQIIPMFVSICAADYGYQAKLSYEINRNAGSASLSEVGIIDKNMISDDGSNQETASEIDIFIIKKRIENCRIEFTVSCNNIENFLKLPYLITVCVSTKKNTVIASDELLIMETSDIDVPLISQMEFPDNIRERICSPSCVSMVQGYYGSSPNVMEFAKDAYQKRHDMYGVWSSNLWAASRRGLLGYIYRFESIKQAEIYINRGIPLIASICYDEGELTTAAVKKTSGHLVVIRGFHNDRIIVNDPAVERKESVAKYYLLNEFKKVWLARKGIAYVLFRLDE